MNILKFNNYVGVANTTTSNESLNKFSNEDAPLSLNFDLEDNNQILQLNYDTREISVNGNIRIKGHDCTISQYFSMMEALRYEVITLNSENRQLNTTIDELRHRIMNLEIGQNCIPDLQSQSNRLNEEIYELNHRFSRHENLDI